MSKNSDSKFVKTHLDCPGCGHKKCFGINSDGSGYCFSCQTRIPNYEEGLVQNLQQTFLRKLLSSLLHLVLCQIEKYQKKPQENLM